MEVYLIKFDTEYSIAADTKNSWLPVFELDSGCPLSKNWPYDIQWYVDAPRANPTDFIYCTNRSSVFAFGPRVYESPLRAYLERFGEIIPLAVEDQPVHYLFNPIGFDFSSSVDVESSGHLTFEGKRYRMRETEFVLRGAEVTNNTIFLLKDHLCGCVFFTTTNASDTEGFLGLYRSLGFTGLDFVKVEPGFVPI